MPVLGFTCLAFAAAASAVQLTSSALAMYRCRKPARVPRPREQPPITLVRPLCGLEPFSRETLSSSFGMDYPHYEILFCVADAADPIIPLARALIAEHPEHDARLLIGQDAIGSNPKLNNMAKGFRQARFAHIVFVDSNVFTPPSYLNQLMNALEKGAGMVSAPPVGQAPAGFWAQLECAFLNSYQARMQYAVDTLGFGFAQGKTLFFRRADLEHGGFAQLAAEPAEDAASTKLIHSKGQRVRLAGPFAQLVGPRTGAQVWQRQVRWARLRRASFPLWFAPEILAGALPPLLALAYGLSAYDIFSPTLLLVFVALWYLPELILARVAGWPRNLGLMMLRDLSLPFIFAAGCAGSSFEWHGKQMTAGHEDDEPAVAKPKRRWARLASRGPAG
ncbi:ceramide glucosyltransferase [Aestuariivirga sp.]|uniref:ceramide glucosyltransferase n=1 Tax=Aestuariivirga sp. TaxID=2650926 RepID=UPI003BA99DE9